MTEKQIELWVKKYGEERGVGWAEDFKANKDFKEMGLVCAYEHCIEHMPLSEEPTEKSCPIFGHDCPGEFDRKECEKLRDLFVLSEDGKFLRRVYIM